MKSFEEFSKEFDINKPEEFSELLKRYDQYMKILHHAYSAHWTWCGNCHKTIRWTDAKVTVEFSAAHRARKKITRCPECGCVWFIHDVDDEEEEHG